MRSAYPELTPILSANTLFFQGLFEVKDEHSTSAPFKPFELEIELPNNFPAAFPVVRETAGRVPRTIHRHVFTDGTACVGTLVDLWQRYENSCHLVTFIGNEVRDWCVYQLCRENKVPYPHGERMHGVLGIFQSLYDLFGTKQPSVVFAYLNVLRRQHISGHQQCPCGSGKRLRDCHGPKFQELHRYITPRRAEELLNQLQS
jgi:hypothetical protein